MKHKKYPKFEDYDFSGCREITGDELYRINGGGRIQPEQNENPPEGDSSNNSDSYTVQSGDTLSQIVHDYNQANGTHLTVDEVAALSGIENPDLILPGQSIVFSNPEQGGDSGQPVDPTAQGGQNPQAQGEYSTPNVESSSSTGSSVPTGQVPNSGVTGNVPFENGVSAEFNSAVNLTSSNQNNIFNATNSNHKSNKQKGNTLADKIAGTLFKFITPNGINVDMNPENKRQNNLKVLTPNMLLEKQLQAYLSGEKELIPNKEYIEQGAIGVVEIGLGVATWVGTTFIAINAEAAALKKGQPVDPSVGVKALSGYIGGTIFIADGFNLLTSAFCKKSAEPICVPIFKELFLSSPYKDFGEVIETYKDSL